jgi:hypothetical protein
MAGVQGVADEVFISFHGVGLRLAIKSSNDFDKVFPG